MSKKLKVIVPRGIQGSGKSYFSKELAEANPKTVVRISMDDIRNMSGQYWVPSRESYIGALKESAASLALREGYNIVLDNMNLSERELSWIESEFSGCEIIFAEFFLPLDICISRDASREKPIGAGILKKTWERSKDSLSKTYWKNPITQEKCFSRTPLTGDWIRMTILEVSQEFTPLEQYQNAKTITL